MACACADRQVTGTRVHFPPASGEEVSSESSRIESLFFVIPVLFLPRWCEMSSEGDPRNTGTEAHPEQVIRVAELQETVDAMVKQALETASTSAAGAAGAPTGPGGESLPGPLPWFLRVTGCS